MASTRPYAAAWAISLGHRRIVHGPWFAHTQSVMGRVVLHPGLPCCGHDPWAFTVTEQRYSTAEHGRVWIREFPEVSSHPHAKIASNAAKIDQLYMFQSLDGSRLTCVCPTVDFLSQVASTFQASSANFHRCQSHHRIRTRRGLSHALVMC